MKKIAILVLLLFAIIKLQAQDYLITFEGTGAATEIDTVKVENLTQGTILTLQGDQVLHLKNNVTGIQSLNQNQFNKIGFYPNPMNDFAFLEFNMPEEGTTHIELFDFSGRKIIQTNKYLLPGQQTFQITGIQSGIYTVRITVGNYLISGILLSHSDVTGIAEIRYQKTNPLQMSAKTLKNATSEVEMQYNEGDRLKYTATKDTYSTVIVDVPSQGKKLTFNLVACTDADGKNYRVVQIGNQTWMAENLAYLPKVSPTTEGYYVYDYTGTSVSGAKASDYYEPYGALYNWSAANKACPPDWHLPSDAEWHELENYLIANGYNYDGTTTGNKIAKSMAATTYWNSYPNTGAIGNNLPANNASGFSALPGGYRGIEGSFFNIGNTGIWWTSTGGVEDTAWARGMYLIGSNVFRVSYPLGLGYSVRCVRDF